MQPSARAREPPQLARVLLSGRLATFDLKVKQQCRWPVIRTRAEARDTTRQADSVGDVRAAPAARSFHG